jgi:hypothetical protein
MHNRPSDFFEVRCSKRVPNNGPLALIEYDAVFGQLPDCSRGEINASSVRVSDHWAAGRPTTSKYVERRSASMIDDGNGKMHIGLIGGLARAQGIITIGD